MSLRESYIRLHLAILLAGGTGLFGKLISLSELPLVWYRIWIAAIFLFFILLFSKRIHKIEWDLFFVSLVVECYLLFIGSFSMEV